jgi:hypothetical protein
MLSRGETVRPSCSPPTIYEDDWLYDLYWYEPYTTGSCRNDCTTQDSLKTPRELG